RLRGPAEKGSAGGKEVVGPGLWRGGLPDAAEDRLEPLDLQRLDDVLVEAGVARSLPVVRLAPAGDGDQDDAAGGGEGAQAARQVVAVEARHADVEEGDVGAEGPGGGETRQPVVLD